MATAVEPTPTRSVGDDRLRGLVFVGAMVVVMWAAETLDAVGAHLDANGIHPRDPGTLPDIAFAPFLHAGWGHLIGNTVPFLVLGGAIALSGLARSFAAYLIARGAFSHRPLHLVAGLAVIAVYGATLAFSLVPHPGVSWQGHLFGAVGGVVAARVLDRKRPPVPA
jgi:membrane associated rhomboid family serine protease